MKAQHAMEADEKFVKSNDSDAKKAFNSDHTVIKSLVVSSGTRNPKVGRGWSMGEIHAAGLTRKQLRTLHLRVDKFRRTAHEDNIQRLKKISATGLIRKKKSGKAKK